MIGLGSSKIWNLAGAKHSTNSTSDSVSVYPKYKVWSKLWLLHKSAWYSQNSKIDKNGVFWPVKLSHYCLEVISIHVTSQTILQWLKSRVCHMSQPRNWQSWQTLAHLANVTLPKQSQVFSKNRSGDIFSRYRAVSVSFSTFLGFFLAFLLFLSTSESPCCHWGTGCPFLDHHLQSNINTSGLKCY